MMLNACKVEAAKGIEKSYKLADGGGLSCSCTNVECSHTFVISVSFSHTISPSALKGQGRIKELIDALPEQDRDKALEILLQAKNRLNGGRLGGEKHARHC